MGGAFGFCSLKVGGERVQTSPKVNFGCTKNVKSLYCSLLQVQEKSFKSVPRAGAKL